ncbi:MAG: prepilin-type N-terminal cleavage/methylation domain-containing protein [Elusimicrobiota bacterium]|jgi:prepilin-type N-terminal cleavage/methylation domain-containing protein
MVKKQRPAGFTLTEMMITVAIVGILSSIGSVLMVQVNKQFLLANTRIDLQREVRAAMNIMIRQLRQAQNATIVLDRHSSSQPFYSRITFTTQQGKTVRFYQDGKQLIQKVNNNQITLSKNVRYLAFTFNRSDDMTIVSLSMTLEKALYQGGKKALHMASEQVQVMN